MSVEVFHIPCLTLSFARRHPIAYVEGPELASQWRQYERRRANSQ
jgi:hypothetical protein